MTQQQFRKSFKTEVLPEVIKQYGKKDIPAIDFAFNCYLDSACKDGQITQKQASKWTRK